MLMPMPMPMPMHADVDADADADACCCRSHLTFVGTISNVVYCKHCSQGAVDDLNACLKVCRAHKHAGRLIVGAMPIEDFFGSKF